MLYQMKKIFLFIAVIVSLSATAQEFDSGDDALKFLSQNFKTSTYVKSGETWTDPVELMFDINEINIFLYHGTIQEKFHNDYSKDKVTELVPDDTENGVVFFTWPEVESVNLELKNGQYWLTIYGPVYNDKSEKVADSRTLYIADKEKAQQIKVALEYCLLEYGS
jgi:hypothetical protein